MEFTPAGIKIRIAFGDPLLVSQGEEPDQIKIRLLKTFFTQNDNGSKTSQRRILLSDESLDDSLESLYYHIHLFDAPRQVRDKEELESLEQAQEAAESFILTQFLLTVGLNLLLAGAFTQLWNIFNTMQLISAFPTFAVKIPSNLDNIHSTFDEMINFEIVNKEQLYDWTIVPMFESDNSDDLFFSG